MENTQKPMLILIAGPYRSGTDGDPARIAANMAALEAYALPIYRAGHIPMIGEWVALPIVDNAEAAQVHQDEDILYTVAYRLLQHCDAVLRVPGESKGADQDVRIARGFRPMTARARRAYERHVQGVALDGRFELYKTTAEHEGPIGRAQHGFPPQNELPA